MNPAGQELAAILFQQALELDPSERVRFLDAKCSDPNIRSEVESLLASHAAAGSFLEWPRSSGPAAESTTLIGATVNQRYLIESVLGSGGQGVAYLAHDGSVGNRLVVVKMLFSSFPDPMQATLRREVEILAELNHPAIVGILDAGEWQGKPFLTIEYVEGWTLRNLMVDGTARSAAPSILRQIGSAMAAVHAKGIAHRDLKPENILIAKSDRRVRLIDFGIARRPRSEAATGTSTFFVAGTLNYMAPEQVYSDHTLASDAYALGVITFEMLTGRLPFADHEVSKRFQRIPELTPAGAQISRRALGLLRRALSSEPSLRPRDVGHMCEQLASEVESGLRRERIRRRSAVAALSAIAMLAIVVWCVWAFVIDRSYERVVGVQRGYDPTKFQFEVVNEMTGKMVFTPDNTGFEGIREFTNTQGYLVHPFTAAQQHAAMEKGWILTGTVRAEEGGAFLIADFDRVNRRYDIFVFRNGHGGTSVRLIDKLIPALLGEEADLGHGEPQFREFRMRFDPRSATASLDVDGRTVLSGYKGHSEYVNPYGLVFGITRYLGERGVSTFGGARFEILP